MQREGRHLASTRRRRILGVAAAATTMVAAALTPAGAALAKPAGAAPPSIEVGTRTLHLCGSGPLAYCGTLPVPLEHGLADSPDITVAFRWYPASAPVGAPSGTLMPVEGGPGYPSIGSVKGGYAVMYGSLMHQWNLLAVDLRGTGDSTVLDCPALQDFSGATGTPAFQSVVGSCGAALNHRWRAPDGGWIHASDLFTSAAAAEDVAAVIRALRVPKVDLYGDSYGTFFAQVFASRFPTLVRSVVLDSAYAARGLDPWYRSTVESMPADFDNACARSPACAVAAPGAAWNRISALAARLRNDPLRGTVPDAEGVVEPLTMDVTGLVDLVNDAAGDPQIYRALDAAARAALQGRPAPLLRLYAQRLAFDEAYFDLPARDYSGALYFAVSCLDYPQLFDMAAAPSVRAEQLASAESSLPARTFAPWSTAEWIAQDQNTEAYSACVSWPSPTDAQPPTLGPAPLFPPTMPVLILGGEFDTWTPPSDEPKVRALIGGHTRFVELANSTHVVGEGDTACGSTLVRGFVLAPAEVGRLDTACATVVPPIRTVGAYPAALAGVPGLQGSQGAPVGGSAGRLAVAEVDTAGDAVARYQAIIGSLDHGLYGGQVTASDGGALLTMDHDQLVPGVAVSGTVTTAAGRIAARLSAYAAGVGSLAVVATWPVSAPEAQARITATIAGRHLTGTTWAP